MLRLAIVISFVGIALPAQAGKDSKGPMFGGQTVKTLIRGKIAESASGPAVSRWVHYKTPAAKHAVRQVLRADKDAIRLIALGSKSRHRAKGYASAIKRNDPRRFKNMSIAVDAYVAQVQAAAVKNDMNLVGQSLKTAIQRIQGAPAKPAQVLRGLGLAARLVD